MERDFLKDWMDRTQPERADARIVIRPGSSSGATP